MTEMLKIARALIARYVGISFSIAGPAASGRASIVLVVWSMATDVLLPPT